MASSSPTDRATINGKSVRIEILDTQDSAFRYQELDEGSKWAEVKTSSVVGVSKRQDDDTVALFYVETELSDKKPDPGHARLRTIHMDTAVHAKLASNRSSSSIYESTSTFKDTIHAKASRLQVIISVESGTGKAKVFFEQVLHPLLQQIDLQDNDYDLYHTTSDQTIIELTRSHILPAAQDGKQQTILLLSGDGGMIDIINALYEETQTLAYRRPDIAILPLGTGNALANSSKTHADNTFSLRSFFAGFSKPLPVFRSKFSPGARLLVNEGQDEAQLAKVNDKPTAYGAVVCSWGFHASLVADSDTKEYRKHGAERFQMAAKEALFPADGSAPHAYQGTVKILPSGVDKQDWEVLPNAGYSYVLATFMSQLEAGFTISPESTSLDGKLRLIRFGALQGHEIMEIMQGAYKGGEHIHDVRVNYQQIDGLRMEFKEDNAQWRRVCIDGKIIRVEKGGWVEVTLDVKPAVNLFTSST